MSLSSLRSFTHDLADEARRLIRARLRHGPMVRRKADGSPVTDIDLAVERRLREMIQAALSRAWHSR